ncbi:hypothetical protein HK405_010521, partial [Cladochytrium tenue]
HLWPRAAAATAPSRTRTDRPGAPRQRQGRQARVRAPVPRGVHPRMDYHREEGLLSVLQGEGRHEGVFAACLGHHGSCRILL